MVRSGTIVPRLILPLTLTFDHRVADGADGARLAADLVRLKPDVIFALGGDVAPSARKATQTIPIIYSMSADPVQLGIAKSLAKPGGNSCTKVAIVGIANSPLAGFT